METPKKSNLTGNFGTPFRIPSSPFMEKLGYGTGVEVFRVRRNLIGESPWAVKSLTKRKLENDDRILYEERLTQEADMLRSLNHPNIVGFRAFKKSNDGRDILAMEDCNTSLGDILEERFEELKGPLPSMKIKKVLIDISSALSYLHTEALLLHGDIKSYNILIKNDYEICKLCDFGVSQPIGIDGFIDRVKKPDAAYVGTSIWLAPEVFDEPENASTKADIFSFGLVIYEMIALQPPHTLLPNDDDDDADADQMVEMNSSVVYGTRPVFPIDIELTEDYNLIMEAFFICTHSDPESRPTAKLINDIFKLSPQ